MKQHNLKQFRSDNNLTQKQCAAIVYCTYNHWYKIEAGLTPMTKAQSALLTLHTDNSERFRKQVKRKLQYLED